MGQKTQKLHTYTLAKTQNPILHTYYNSKFTVYAKSDLNNRIKLINSLDDSKNIKPFSAYTVFKFTRPDRIFYKQKQPVFVIKMRRFSLNIERIGVIVFDYDEFIYFQKMIFFFVLQNHCKFYGGAFICGQSRLKTAFFRFTHHNQREHP